MNVPRPPSLSDRLVDEPTAGGSNRSADMSVSVPIVDRSGPTHTRTQYARELGPDWPAAPDFTLPDETGRPVRLGDQLRQGPVVLVFYRGDRCSYCNAQLAGFAARASDLDALGARVLAISVDDVPKGAPLRTTLRFPFPVLSDPRHEVIDRYAGLEAGTRRGLAVGKPATYVLDRHGRIRWQYVGEDFADRPLVFEVLAQVAAARD